LFVIIIIHSYFVNSLQGSVKTSLRCGGICSNHVIANCPQCASKRILKIG